MLKFNQNLVLTSKHLNPEIERVLVEGTVKDAKGIG